MITLYFNRTISICCRATLCALLFFGFHDALLAQKRFTRLKTSQTQIDFSNDVKDTKAANILIYSNFYGGAGVGVGDFNNDGFQDLYFAGNQVTDRLYLNRGDFQFKDVTKTAGLQDDHGWSTGVTVADVNNDGFLDIYVSRELYDDKPQLRRNLLYINQGDGTFEERAQQYGIADRGRTRHATFLDYNKDGLLDLFLLTQPPNPGSYSKFSGEKLLLPEYHLKLYRNTGQGHFEDVSASSGIALTGFPNAVSASDLNGDGWTDLYITNDFYAPDFVFMNNQDGTFTNQADTALKHMSYYSMGVDVADINNDALLDVYVLDMVAEDNFRLKSNMSGMNPKAFWQVVDNGGHYQYMFNMLQLNNGNGTFSDVAQLTETAATDWSWSNLIADFDNDGNKDIYVTNGLLRDIRNTDADKKVASYVSKVTREYLQKHPDGGNIKTIWDILDIDKVLRLIPSQPLKNYAFKNKGHLEFANVSNIWGLDTPSFSNGSAYADLDNDGDLDLIVNNINEKAFIYKNNSESLPQSNALNVFLKSKKHQPVWGSKIKISTAKQTQFVELTNVRGSYSTSQPIAHFGLGELSAVPEVLVTWPNGTETRLHNIEANKPLVLYMEDAAMPAPSRPVSEKKETPFESITSKGFLKAVHQENNFDDYAQQVLLPHKLSQFGPALAVADVNGDTLEDVYLGNATGFSSKIWLQNTQGTFVPTTSKVFDHDAENEAVDALFFDIDNDGDQDLYVVNGGNEFEVNSPSYQDALYINDGTGHFAKGHTPMATRISGSVVRAYDFDKDGDQDLFIGGRLLPHQYPMAATSLILENRAGTLVDVTAQKAQALHQIGMVTDALWTDYDNDQDIDLLLVGEWMPISIFENNHGLFTKTTTPSLANTKGWWFGVQQGDFDNDGDMDYVAGNLGLNYKYKTSPEAPFDVYYYDFDKNGSSDIVLGYYQANKHYPLRGFSCSSEQIPSLKKTFKKYDVFASLEIENLYGKKNLDKALHYTTDTFATTYIENLGSGKFKHSALPLIAQKSNVSALLIGDFNKDENLDIIAAGNLYVSEIETTRNDAGIGALLLGDGHNNFKSVNPLESGFFADKDVRKIRRLRIGKEQFLLVANNNDTLQVFRAP